MEEGDIEAVRGYISAEANAGGARCRDATALHFRAEWIGVG